MSDGRSPDLPSVKIIRPGSRVGPKPLQTGPKISWTSCSSLGAFLICPQYHGFGYELGLRPTEDKEALILGGLIHVGLAYHYGLCMNPRPEWMVYPSPQAPDPRQAIWTCGQDNLDIAEKALKIFDAYTAFYNVPTLQPVLIEHQFDSIMDIDGVPEKYTLRIDLLAIDTATGELVLLDHKSIYKFTKWVGMDYRTDREMLTGLALCRAHGYDVKRVVINGIQKGTKERPEPRFERFDVPISESAYNRLASDIVHGIRTMRFTKQAYPDAANRPRVTESCVRKYGRCVVAGTRVHTLSGWKAIEDVAAGERVLGADGKHHSVSAVSSRDYNGDVITVIPRWNGMGVTVTPDHRVLADGVWVEAESLQPNMTVKTPVLQSSALRSIEMMPFVADVVRPRRFPKTQQDPDLELAIQADQGNASHRVVAKLYGVDPGVVLRIWRNMDKSRAIRPVQAGGRIMLYGEQFRSLPATLRLSPALAELAGLYIAEGSASHKVVFSFGSHERALVKRCRDLVRQVLREPTTLDVRGSVTNVVVSHTLWARVFKQWFGGYSQEKHIPVWLEAAPFDLFKHVLRGWTEGDGGCADGIRAYGITTSPTLALQMIQGLAREGLYASLVRTPPGKGGMIDGRRIVPRYATYSVSLQGDVLRRLARFLHVPPPIGKSVPWTPQPRVTKNAFHPVIRKLVRAPYIGRVYDLAVPTSENFVANNVVVHNCQFYPVCADGPQNLVQFTRKW